MTQGDPQSLVQFLRTITERMHVPCDVSVAGGTDGSPITLTIQTSEDANLLIGKDGQNLKALEHVVRAVWARREPGGRQITIDINDYRKTRTAELAAAVHETARRVRDTRQPEALKPMTSYERRVVHTELAAYHDLATESIGVEPHRRVVIKLL
jgi:spoIIIJ-associated protein